MSRLTQLKLGFTTMGLLVFGYGYRVDDSVLRWIGIAFVAVAFCLRLVGRDRREDRHEETSAE